MRFSLCFPLDKIPKGQTHPQCRANGAGLGRRRSGKADGAANPRQLGAGVCHQYRMVRPKPVEWAKPESACRRLRLCHQTNCGGSDRREGHANVNVTKDVEMWYNGDATNHGWILTADEPGTSLNLMSPISDYPAGRGVWKLTIEYVPE